jgi:hypothetical protein
MKYYDYIIVVFAFSSGQNNMFFWFYFVLVCFAVSKTSICNDCTGQDEKETKKRRANTNTTSIKLNQMMQCYTMTSTGEFRSIATTNSVHFLNSFQAIRAFEMYANIFSLAKQRVNFLQKELGRRNNCTRFGGLKRDFQWLKTTHTLSQSSIELRAIQSGCYSGVNRASMSI